MSSTGKNGLEELPVDKEKIDVPLEEFHSRDDDAPPALSAEDERRLWRKVDLRLMPILSVMYLLSFMDRGG